MDNRRYNDRNDFNQSSNYRGEQNRSFSDSDSSYDNREMGRRQNFSPESYDRARPSEGSQDFNSRFDRSNSSNYNNNQNNNYNSSYRDQDMRRSDMDRNRSSSYSSYSSSYPSYPSYGATYGSSPGSSYGSSYGAGSSFGSSTDRNYQGYGHENNYSNYQNNDRGLMERAEEGWEHLKQSAKNFFGKGPKGYKRSDERIKEDVSDVLYRHPRIDASEIEIDVKDGMVTLRGTVEDRQTKRLVEDVVEDCSGVSNVSNQLLVSPNFGTQNPTSATTQSQTATTTSGRSKSIQ